MPSVSVGWDEEGSAVSVSGGAVAGGAVSRNGSTAIGRADRYVLQGYSTTLVYRNGTMRTLPSFFLGEGGSVSWFDGDGLRR